MPALQSTFGFESLESGRRWEDDTESYILHGRRWEARTNVRRIRDYPT